MLLSKVFTVKRQNMKIKKHVEKVNNKTATIKQE